MGLPKNGWLKKENPQPPGMHRSSAFIIEMATAQPCCVLETASDSEKLCGKRGCVRNKTHGVDSLTNMLPSQFCLQFFVTHSLDNKQLNSLHSNKLNMEPQNSHIVCSKHDPTTSKEHVRRSMLNLGATTSGPERIIAMNGLTQL